MNQHNYEPAQKSKTTAFFIISKIKIKEKYVSLLFIISSSSSAKSKSQKFSLSLQKKSPQKKVIIIYQFCLSLYL
jgi:hypothetical protein